MIELRRRSQRQTRQKLQTQQCAPRRVTKIKNSRVKARKEKPKTIQKPDVSSQLLNESSMNENITFSASKFNELRNDWMYKLQEILDQNELRHTQNVTLEQKNAVLEHERLQWKKYQSELEKRVSELLLKTKEQERVLKQKVSFIKEQENTITAHQLTIMELQRKEQGGEEDDEDDDEEKEEEEEEKKSPLSEYEPSRILITASELD
jgi:hypothetical protein